MATLTYVYSEQTAVLGPLATYAEPHTYDLCVVHAKGLTAPRGWDVIRLLTEYAEPSATPDDLLALADAVREVGGPRLGSGSSSGSGTSTSTVAALGARPQAEMDGTRETGRRGHLRILRDR